MQRKIPDGTLTVMTAGARPKPDRRSTTIQSAVPTQKASRLDRSAMAGTRWLSLLTRPQDLFLPWLGFLVIMPTFGGVVIVVYGIAEGGANVIAVSFMVACGAFSAGGLVGFLFGVPRALSATDSDSATQGEARLRSNSNLEQISDWLTKILVGVGLVQIGEIAHAGSRLVASLAPALGAGPTGEAFAAGLLVFFTTAGFMTGYFVTRVFLGLVFAWTEYDLQHGDPHDEQQPEPPSAAGRDRG